MTDPWSLPGDWLKTALHTHSIESDGTCSASELVGHYASDGFDVVALTDHWKVTKEPSLPGTLVIPGAELAIDPLGTGRYSELLAIGIDEIPDDPGGDRQYWEHIDNYDFKTFPDYTTAAANVNDQGGVAFACHPYWSGLPPETILKSTGLAGLEVFNTSAEREDGRGDSSYVWDLALEAGMTLTGIATDDTHYPEFDVGDGWVMVRAPERTQQAVVDALRTGAFYSSCGPELIKVSRDGGAIEVSCSPCLSVQIHSSWERGWSVRADDRNMPLMAEIKETSPDGSITRAAFDIDDPDARFFRVVLVDAAGRKAWSNCV